jgi:hypothetical protein
MELYDAYKGKVPRWVRVAIAVVLFYGLSYGVWSRCAAMYSWYLYKSNGYYFVFVLPRGASEKCEIGIQIFYYPCTYVDCRLLGWPYGPSSMPMYLD